MKNKINIESTPHTFIRALNEIIGVFCRAANQIQIEMKEVQQTKGRELDGDEDDIIRELLDTMIKSGDQFVCEIENKLKED